MRTVIYPGSFDPLHNGHLDVVRRAAQIFDRVVVAVAANEGKRPLFNLEERYGIVRDAVRDLPNVTADRFDGLLVSYVVRQGACAVLRGLRAVSDFEFEFQLALMNRKLDERVETLFLTPKDTYTFVSSRLIKEIARLGGDVSPFVPDNVVPALRAKLGRAAAA
ncbi:MAG: pantetheine-phosphate adenylyltransferase [Verrucomicrobiae bacterium]|nr:pantetheine-phosphate adenylyltransferase [Verrucomicrobiae bacterium]